MGWTNIPAPTGTDVDAYSWLVQFWKAAREKAWAIGSQFTPVPNHIWTNGPVDTLVDNHDGTYTLTDNHTTLAVANNRWFGFSDPTNTWIPAFYDLVIDDPDETKVVKSPIGGSTYASGVATYTLDTATLQTYVTSKQITSISSLAGKNYYVIKRGGFWWSDRWPEWPNDWEYWVGSETSSMTVSITDSAAHWAAHQWQPSGGVGYELMIAGQRVPILDNTTNTISFSALGSAPTGAYSIVKAGARWRNTKSWPYKAWYRGSYTQYYSHYPDDTLTGTNQPAISVLLQSNPPDCDMTFSQPIYDLDFFTDLMDRCNEADKCYNPDLFKTIRGVQLFIESICQWFVDKNLTYDHATAIAPFVPATFFRTAGINAYTTTVTALSGDGITIPAQTFPYTPIPVHFAVLDANGNVQNYSAVGAPGSAASTTHISGAFTAADVGQTLVLSLGWTRYYPREVMEMFYDTWCFIPGVSTGAVGDPPAGNVVDPPTSATPGQWKLRAKSTTYKNHSVTGLVVEGPFTFNDGDAARYAGDNWNDPTIEPLIALVGGDATLMSYYDNFYTGKHSIPHAALDGMPSGKSTGGSTTQLQDTTANWWGSVMLTTSGTANSGNTTSLGDTTKATDGRWNATTGRWIGFVVEVQISGTWYRRPITGFTGTTITWTEALPGGANGAAYQIREAGAGSASVVGYTRNRYAGRTLTVKDPSPGGLQYTIPILYSDDNTLYFAAQSFTIGANWPYSVTENKPGGVYLWDATHSKWVAPTGLDSRTAQPWHTNLNENLPTKFKDFGRWMCGDYFGQHIITELYNAFQQLVWTWLDLSWDSEFVDGTPENNDKTALDTAEGFTPYSSAESYYALAWANAPDGPTAVPGSPSNFYRGSVAPGAGPPLAYATCGRFPTLGGGAYGDTLQGDRIYAYALATVPTYMQSGIDYYVWGTIDSFDHDPGSGYSFDANGDTIQYHHWRKFDSSSANNTPTRKSNPFGNPAMPLPNPPPEPTVDGTSTFNGYYVGNQLAIVKWDVAGGMFYL